MTQAEPRRQLNLPRSELRLWILSNVIGWGTSASAPHVAAIAALLMDSAPNATPAQIRNALTKGAIDLGPAGRDSIFGWGRVDALSANGRLDSDSDGTINSSDADDDNDGMSDTFEVANGFQPLNAADATLDADSDGFTNLEEFQTGSNPTDPDDPGETGEPSEPASVASQVNSLPWLMQLLMD